MLHRSIVAILVIVGGMWLAGCTDPSAGGSSGPGAGSPPPATPAPTLDGDYAY
jgi:hypothetical protein